MSERIVTPSQEDKWFDYIYLGGILIGRIDSQVNGEANVYAYHNDHLGTPLIMTDKNQEVVWAADYEPFGSAWVTTSTIENNIRFPGQYYDDESGMHYNWHRYYQPEFGAYVQADPLASLPIHNQPYFVYALNNPLGNIDFYGLRVEDCGDCAEGYDICSETCIHSPQFDPFLHHGYEFPLELDRPDASYLWTGINDPSLYLSCIERCKKWHDKCHHLVCFDMHICER